MSDGTVIILLLYIYIMDNEKIIKEMYLGKMRYWNSQFSLTDYKYHDDSSLYGFNYSHLERQDCGSSTYGVLNLNTINKIRKVLRDKPINKEELEAYEDTVRFIEFVDENLDMIKENNYNIVFYTSHDF